MKTGFRKYLEEAIGSENALVAFPAFDTPASVSLRRNPSKSSAGVEEMFSTAREVPWSRYGVLLDNRPVFTLDPAFHGGAYYVQDSSAMFVGEIFRRSIYHSNGSRTIRVLDLCAAPGGKTTDLASSLREVFGDGFLLVSNEVMKQRCSTLAGNVALWGDPNVIVTNDDPSAFAALDGFFDVIVADVPCSGEGMFRKDEKAVEQWSEDNVALCSARQRRIVADVWPALAPGGVFIYSTCTFNRIENDDNAKWFVEELGAELLSDSLNAEFDGVLRTGYGFSLVPGLVPGEGQYCAAFRKNALEVFGSERSRIKESSRTLRVSRTPVTTSEAKRLSPFFSCDMTFRQKGTTYIAVPEAVDSCLSLLEGFLHVVAAGCAVGMVKGHDLIPDADMALSLKFSKDIFPRVDIDRKTALAYLHKDAVAFPDAPKGYLTVVYDSLPLGFVKNLGNRCNSLHPQSRRIRMDIE